MLKYILLAFVAAIITWDIFVLATKGYSYTASANLNKAAKAYPIVPFLFGVLIGHVLWGQ